VRERYRLQDYTERKRDRERQKERERKGGKDGENERN